MKVLRFTTHAKVEFIDCTDKIQALVQESGIRSGMCLIFVPHTTAAITINEGTDPSVRHDIISQLANVFPEHANHYRHAEGNSSAHINASMLGASEMIIIEDATLHLGTWQSIYFCEFDGPRRRKLVVKIIQND